MDSESGFSVGLGNGFVAFDDDDVLAAGFELGCEISADLATTDDEYTHRFDQPECRGERASRTSAPSRNLSSQ